MLRLSAGLVLALSALPAMAHIALWDPAMFGWQPDNPNSQDQVEPLMHLPFSQWWFHGYIDQPPAPDTYMTLPSGGTYHGQVACNKALTTYGQNPAQQTGIYACDGDGPTGGIGAMHTTDSWGSPNPTNVKGCGISIAYESDEKKVRPEDFTVISVNHTCPWFKHVDFQIPNDLPACPEGGCHCSFGWVHSELSGSEQNYHLMYRCKVDGAKGMTPIPRANTANKCDYPVDTSNCTVGAKQPHYWYQAEGNNNPQGEYDPPFYNGAYGFMNGAQTDLFATVGGAKIGGDTAVPVPATSPPPLAEASVSADIPVPVSSAIQRLAASSFSHGGAPSAVNAIAAPSTSAASSNSSDPHTSFAPAAKSSATVASAATSSAPGSLSTKPASNATSPGKICKRGKRSLNRNRLLPASNFVASHRQRAAKRSSPHVIAQRRWEGDRARRGLGKESLGKGVY